MQEKYGELRVADVGIREATILGQGIGIAWFGDQLLKYSI
jgi:pyruvate/2-oxoglutarate/acetoin dehydrogenase E1 component